MNNWAEHFKLRWRFVDERYNKLPESSLNKIVPLPENEAEYLWETLFTKKYLHIMQIPKTEMMDRKFSFKVDCDEETEGELLLLKHFPEIYQSKHIIFFWAKSCVVKTEWGVFCKYWSDFCYPSDDNNVIAIDNKLKIIFCEEMFFGY